jgi:hypothetical protein
MNASRAPTSERVSGRSVPWTVVDDAALAAILELRRGWNAGHRTLKALGFSYRRLPDEEEVVQDLLRTY